MPEHSADETNARNHDRQTAAVAESIESFHRGVPKAVIESLAEEALEKTEDAPIQGLRVPLAQHDVREGVAAWEHSHPSDDS